MCQINNKADSQSYNKVLIIINKNIIVKSSLSVVLCHKLCLNFAVQFKIKLRNSKLSLYS